MAASLLSESAGDEPTASVVVGAGLAIVRPVMSWKGGLWFRGTRILRLWEMGTICPFQGSYRKHAVYTRYWRASTWCSGWCSGPTIASGGPPGGLPAATADPRQYFYTASAAAGNLSYDCARGRHCTVSAAASRRHVDASLDLFTRKSPRIWRDLLEKRALSARRLILWMVGV